MLWFMITGNILLVARFWHDQMINKLFTPAQSSDHPDQSSLYTRLEKNILAKNTNDATSISFVNQLRKTLQAQESRGHFDSDIITTPEAST